MRADRLDALPNSVQRIASGFAELLRASIAWAEHPRSPNDRALAHLEAASLALHLPSARRHGRWCQSRRRWRRQWW